VNNQTAVDRAAAIADAIGPTMLLGLQDAELFDEPGRERIREWVKWISETVAALPAVLPATADRAAVLREAAELGRELSRQGYSAQEIARKLDRMADEAQPARPAHACRNCLGVDPDTCLANQDRPGTECGARHYQHPDTVCTEPGGHYQRATDPHAGPLILDGRECGRVAWDEPAVEAQPAQPQTGEAEPVLLRWGLDDILYGDDDATTVLLSGPAGEPYWLELEPDRAAALRQALDSPTS
jgi:hypothetical protein